MPETPASPHRIALIGYGTAGAVFHAPLIAATPGLGLAAIVTGNTERAASAAARYPQTEILATTDALWPRAADFDAVVVASPNISHVPLAMAAVQAGLAVVVDKPLAADSHDARRLIEAARAAGVLLTVFHNRRWDADFLTVADLLAANRLGTVRRFESRFERWRPEAKPGWKRDDDPAAAGGILFDLGSHLIDQALVLFGPVAHVHAELCPRYSNDGVDDDSFVALTHHNGVISHLWMSSVAPALGPRFRVLGDRAGYVTYGLDPQEAALREGAVPETADWGHEQPSAYGHWVQGEQQHPVTSRAGDYPAFYRGLAEALSGRADVPVAPEDALAVIEIIEAARRADRQTTTRDLAASART